MFTYYDKTTAPDESKPIMDQSQKIFGTVPNLHKIFAVAPTTYELYNFTFSTFGKTSLSPLEQQVVMMTANYENRCHYCIAGHTMMMKASNMPDEIIEALREGHVLPDAKLEALRTFVRRLIENRGHMGDEKFDEFLSAGYSRKQALEVLAGLAAKTLSNYTNALAKTELDPVIQEFEWRHPADRN